MSYGYRRIKIELEREFNIYKSENTIRRYMNYLNLSSKIRKKKRSSEAKNLNVKYKDLIKREFSSNEPFKKIFTDVTYIQTSSGWSFLSITIDIFNHEIID